MGSSTSKPQGTASKPVAGIGHEPDPLSALEAELAQAQALQADQDLEIQMLEAEMEMEMEAAELEAGGEEDAGEAEGEDDMDADELAELEGELAELEQELQLEHAATGSATQLGVETTASSVHAADEAATSNAAAKVSEEDTPIATTSSASSDPSMPRWQTGSKPADAENGSSGMRSDETSELGVSLRTGVIPNSTAASTAGGTTCECTSDNTSQLDTRTELTGCLIQHGMSKEAISQPQSTADDPNADELDQLRAEMGLG